MKKLQKTVLLVMSVSIMMVSLSADGFASQSPDNETSAIGELKYPKNHFEVPFTKLKERVFPDNYPEFLKQVYIVFRQAERLKTLSASDRESILKGQAQKAQEFFRAMLKQDELNIKQLSTFTRAQVGEKAFQTFLRRFGINYDNDKDIELEILAQITRMLRREAYHIFVHKFSNTSHKLASRVEIVKGSMAPRELEYALRY